MNTALTMTQALRQAIQNAPSVYIVAKHTGLETASLYRFLYGKTSLRLDLADRLAVYFNIRVSAPEQKGTKHE